MAVSAASPWHRAGVAAAFDGPRRGIAGALNAERQAVAATIGEFVHEKYDRLERLVDALSGELKASRAIHAAEPPRSGKRPEREKASSICPGCLAT